MTGTEVLSNTAVGTDDVRTMDMRLEVVVIPVSDVDRAKRFYTGLGWRLDADRAVDDEFRVVQVTPPGSSCSVVFGTGVSRAAPGSAAGLELIVSDIEMAGRQLADRGAEVSRPFHGSALREQGRIDGLDPQRRSYQSYATFADPDGNTWLLQEITGRLPGRA